MLCKGEVKTFLHYFHALLRLASLGCGVMMSFYWMHNMNIASLCVA